MENVGDALKMAFAVFVFVIAMWIALSLLGQANATAREIFFSMDKITYLDPQRVGGSGANNRIVGLETIIPTIYRYSVENCGVTIIDKDGNLVARYDTETDNVGRQIEKYLAYSKNSLPSYEVTEGYHNYLKHIDYLVNILSGANEKLGLNIKIGAIDTKEFNDITYSFSKNIDEKIQSFYKYEQTSYYKDDNGEKKEKRREIHGLVWGTDVAERLEADFSGKIYEYKYNKNDSSDDNDIINTYKPVIEGGLLSYMNDKNKVYKEYIIEEGTEYKVMNYEDQYNKETQNAETRKTTKIEIIYVEQ